MSRERLRGITRRLVVGAYAVEQKLLGGKGLSRIPLLVKLRRCLFARVQPKTVEVEGLILEVDVSEGPLDLRAYKRSVVALLTREVRTGQTVVDVGANVGYFTCLAARQVGTSGAVIAFEPDPANVAMLERNVARNALRNVRVMPMAASDVAQTVELFPGGARSALGFHPCGQRVASMPVKSVRLDEVLKGRNVDFIKMDVIGSEPKALRGIQELVRANRNIKLLSAFCPKFIEQAGENPRAYLNLLSSLGFRIYDITHGDARVVEEGKFSGLLAAYSGLGGIKQAELYCARS